MLTESGSKEPFHYNGSNGDSNLLEEDLLQCFALDEKSCVIPDLQMEIPDIFHYDNEWDIKSSLNPDQDILYPDVKTLLDNELLGGSYLSPTSDSSDSSSGSSSLSDDRPALTTNSNGPTLSTSRIRPERVSKNSKIRKKTNPYGKKTLCSPVLLPSPPKQEPNIVSISLLESPILISSSTGNNGEFKFPISKSSKPSLCSIPQYVTAHVTTAPVGSTISFGSILNTTNTFSSPTYIKSEPITKTPASKINYRQINEDTEARVLKRQQRMIKNREAASLSRMKRKEYVTSLENQINTLVTENESLKNENQILKRQLQELSSSQTFGKMLEAKKRTVLLAGFCFLFWNIGLYNPGSILQSPNPEPEQNSRTNFHSRSLLWFKDLQPLQPELLSNVSHTCPLYVNTTENARINNELRGLIFNLKEDKPILEQKRGIANPKEHRRTKKIIHLRKSMKFFSNDSVGLKHQFFFNAIKRKQDTFYVVTFSEDQLLLPASFHNQSSRPKMALLMPAVPVNGTANITGTQQVAMVQIDCEVVNTKLLHIDAQYVPKGNTSDQSATQPVYGPLPDVRNGLPQLYAAGRVRNVLP